MKCVVARGALTRTIGASPMRRSWSRTASSGPAHLKIIRVLRASMRNASPSLTGEHASMGLNTFRRLEPDDEYPLILTTGRVIYHYLSGNQTRRVPFLNEQAPYPWVEIHEQTAQRLGIADGDWVTVRTRRGE